MVTFLLSLILLVIGYAIYGKFIDGFFGMDKSKKTPALELQDGVDFFPMKPWRIFVIQFLNIAGLGPIFGAILGAMYGPMAYLWIVLGCIFMGGVHDYFSGMLSVRDKGMSLPEIVGKYLGNNVKMVLRVFTLVLLVFVGVAFVTGPAGLLDSLTGGGKNLWLYIIFAYYLIATLLPIDKIIGKVYPFFGAALLLMAVGVGGSIVYNYFFGDLNLIELTFDNMRNFHSNPENNILFPMLFVVISCGAISGFHSTQSPMMARCMTNEKYGRPIFYGAMVAEGIVAMIWATAAMNFFGGVDGLNSTIAAGHDPAWIVNEICNSWLGKIGAIFAIVGVVACPITTGDTAFRSSRLILSDMFKMSQAKVSSRLLISIPLFVLGYILSQMDFSTIWKYLGIANQILATIMLWTGASYLKQNNKAHYFLSIPAFFLTIVCVTYFLIAPIKNGGLYLNHTLSYSLGIGVGLILFFLFCIKSRKLVSK
ncbi:carbon starvation protein A [Marinilabiliaceae bacterium JC040]|nr:carbon starvation protein A [Marinilabiliaceae bacterium JC040]